jgi:hypothetical protein
MSAGGWEGVGTLLRQGGAGGCEKECQRKKKRKKPFGSFRKELFFPLEEELNKKGAF